MCIFKQTFKISYVKLDYSYHIIEMNSHFRLLFNIDTLGDENYSIQQIIFLDSLTTILSRMKTNQISSLVLIKNIIENGGIMFLYLYIVKHEDFYTIRIINWLNWVHHLYESFGKSYNFVSNLNNELNKDNFVSISDASCFKALYPLITHVPYKFVYGINQGVLFDIMHLFVKQRDEDKFTKDYARNIYSRLRTNLKKEFEIENVDMMTIIQNEELLKIKANGEIFIPRVQLKKDMLCQIESDSFLDNLINGLHPI